MPNDKRPTAAFGYYVNFDRPDNFFADVRNALGKTVFELRDTQIIEHGVMRDKRDVEGLRDFLVERGVMSDDQLLLLMAA
jgi:hypothetical protein